MGKEIERKFLVKGDWENYPGLVSSGKFIQQGYLTDTDVDLLKSSVRVRVTDNYGQMECFLTIKSNIPGISRDEFEYEIPYDDAMSMLNKLCMGSIISKRRYELMLDSGQKLELDVFKGDNDGLVIAEVELQSEDDYIDLPDFIGEEVSHDPRYFNLQLVEKPYKNWK